MSSTRQHFQNFSGGRFPLRKQKSISDTTAVNKSNESKRLLHRQSSVDSRLIMWSSSAQNLSDPNLKISPTNLIKKRAQSASMKIESESIDDLTPANKNTPTNGWSKSRENKDTRININLLLSSVSHDNENTSDDSSHVENQVFNLVKLPLNQPATRTPTTICNSNKTSALSIKRAQFQSNRVVESVERKRPPLVRAMSAPIRPMAEDPFKMQAKRKTRRRKIIRDKDDDDSPDESYEEKIDFKTSSNAQQNQQKILPKQQKPPHRSRSVLGCDQIGIETLVSMLNSEASDSEKDETPVVKPEVPKNRASMLRKTVSFQEEDGSKDIPMVYKRGSVIPFTARLRNGRNPSLSSLGQSFASFAQSYPLQEDAKVPVDKNENDLNSNNKSKEKLANIEKIKEKRNEAKDDASLQEKTPKEQECYRLYQKMTNLGLSVSYDTILRGLLKPTELRMLEKQKKIEATMLEDIQEQQNSINIETSEKDK